MSIIMVKVNEYYEFTGIYLPEILERYILSC